jgi:hypothetical protein
LPRFLCGGHCEERGPELAVDQSDFAIEELDKKNIRMLGEFRQHFEDETTFWMRPPMTCGGILR